MRSSQEMFTRNDKTLLNIVFTPDTSSNKHTENVIMRKNVIMRRKVQKKVEKHSK